MIFGIIHTDQGYIQDAAERFCSNVAPEQCELLTGEQFTLGISKKSDISREKICSRGGIYVALSGEVYTPDQEFTVGEQEHDYASIFTKLYLRLGSDALSATSGQFCAAVWDKEQRELKLFLDRSGGIKTLYYTRLPDGFVFCSSLSALLSVLQMERILDTEVVRELFSTGYILPPKTLVKNVFKICPGEEVLYKNGTIHTRMVDHLRFDSSSKNTGSAEELSDLLVKSLGSLTRESETGFLLSGGIDSSVLVALTAQRLKKPMATFTATFPGTPLDESMYAKIVADKNNCTNEAIDLNQASSLDDLPEIVWHLGEPFLDFSAIPTFHLFKQVRKKTSIIISGDGPDHLFGRFYPLAAKRYVYARYSAIIKLLALFPSTFPSKILNAGNVSLAEAYRGLFSLPAWGVEANHTLGGLLNIPAIKKEEMSSYAAAINIPLEDSLTGCMDAVATLDFYQDGSFGVFAKIGRMAEAHDLVVREPYLDRLVSDYIAQLPLCQKQGGMLLHLLASRSREKMLLKFGVGDQYLPREIVNKGKGGFTPPLGVWLRETVCTLQASHFLCNTLKISGYFNPAVIDSILQEHRLGQRDWSRVIFLILSFDLWVRMYIESEGYVFPGWKLREIYGL
jgi:asparagine synthase (glutamine-hydrolysing)